ncbi:MAG: RodZ domain-containing protein [Cyanobacteria bacterium J06639_14]
MNKVSPSQQEKLLNVGAYLQGIRKEQEKTIDEVANQIFIRPALVRAIEAADWESLPEPVFVQGFIRRYADYLGLDGLEIAKQFKPAHVSVLSDLTVVTAKSNGAIESEDGFSSNFLSQASPSPARGKRAVSSGTWKWLLGLLAIAALIAGGIWAGTRSSLQTATTNVSEATPTGTDAEPEETQDVESEAAAESASETVAEISNVTNESAESSAPITFQIDLEDDAWMEVRVDGEEVYEGILSAGTQESWQAENEIRVIAGNSGAVMYSFNGSNSAPLGAPGSVTKLTLTPDTDPQALQPQ